MIPMVKNDLATMTRYMDLAEEYGRVVRDEDTVLFFENFFPLMQSRSKEALLLKNIDLAIERLKVLLPYDSDNGLLHLELGNMYMKNRKFDAAREAWVTGSKCPPPWDIQCSLNLADLEKRLGAVERASSVCLEILRLDPWCVSALQTLNELGMTKIASDHWRVIRHCRTNGTERDDPLERMLCSEVRV